MTNPAGMRFELLDASGEPALAFDEVIYVGRIPRGEVDGQSVMVSLVISDGMVSRVHAVLRPTVAGIEVADLQSTNGTYVNDQRIDGVVTAGDGDRLRFDVVEYLLRDHCPPAGVDPAAEALAAASQGTIVRPAAVAASPPAVAGSGLEEWPLPVIEPTVEVPVVAGQPLAGGDAGAGIEAQEGVSGGTVVLQAKDLPPGWMPAGKGTVIVAPAPGEAGLQADARQFAQDLTAPVLIVLTSATAGIPHQLTVTSELCFWSIGRDAVNNELQIIIDDPSVSGLHAKLVCRAGKWSIADQMSANRTYVGGKPFARKFLRSGDQIRLGNVECLFLLPASGRPRHGMPNRDARSRRIGRWLLLAVAMVAAAAVAWWAIG